MDGREGKERTYTVCDVALMTGLNPRTIREYLRRGLLKGERTAAGWRFTVEQFVALLSRPEVGRSIRAKEQGTVLDFLSERKKAAPAACVILDIPVEPAGEEALRERLLVSNGEGLSFRYRMEGTMARITATGTPARIAALLREIALDPCSGQEL